MATATSPGISFSNWLEKYLTTLSDGIDTEVYGDYIEGLLKDETLDKQEIIESIRSFLESVLVNYILSMHAPIALKVSHRRQ